MADFAKRGSQRWFQTAVNLNPEVLRRALVQSGAIEASDAVEWQSPLASDQFCEYRDRPALSLAGVRDLKSPLEEFWPSRGPVWDGIGTVSGRPLFVEAKAHVGEAASPGTRASLPSRRRIETSLAEAREFYAPSATADWCATFYQYANRLAHHYFLRVKNGVSSTLVFVYFINDRDMAGPSSEEEWHDASRLIHAALGLPADLRAHHVFDAFVDIEDLMGESHGR
jgi:hypothetical protein